MSNLDFHTQNYIQNGLKINQSLAEAEQAKRKDNLFYLAISFVVLTLMLVVLTLNSYVFFVALVDGDSMKPTLIDGDKLITNRYKEPEVGSIITVREDGELWIKRVIAVGGDTVEILDGNVYVNGKLKSEPYLTKSGITEARNGVNRWVLAEDEIFFMGDNRLISKDAREVGPCKVSDVAGVVEEWSLWLNQQFK